MPSFLKVNPLRQETPYTCLPACIRMVLGYYGYAYSESQIAEWCNTTVLGTLVDQAVRGLLDAGHDALTQSDLDFDSLVDHTSQEVPPIATLEVAPLPKLIRFRHAVVVVGIEEEEVVCNDPTSGETTRLTKEDFLYAWFSAGAEVLVVLP
ncbi:MAG: C39 family peptidase [Armatimonadetes bacterium]|nr:C39 family peptidase [Armatimonadota bacterium]